MQNIFGFKINKYHIQHAFAQFTLRNLADNLYNRGPTWKTNKAVDAERKKVSILDAFFNFLTHT